jgi:hypothetical protein
MMSSSSFGKESSTWCMRAHMHLHSACSDDSLFIISWMERPRLRVPAEYLFDVYTVGRHLFIHVYVEIKLILPYRMNGPGVIDDDLHALNL